MEQKIRTNFRFSLRNRAQLDRSGRGKDFEGKEVVDGIHFQWNSCLVRRSNSPHINQLVVRVFFLYSHGLVCTFIHIFLRGAFIKATLKRKVFPLLLFCEIPHCLNKRANHNQSSLHILIVDNRLQHENKAGSKFGIGLRHGSRVIAVVRYASNLWSLNTLSFTDSTLLR